SFLPSLLNQVIFAKGTQHVRSNKLLRVFAAATQVVEKEKKKNEGGSTEHSVEAVLEGWKEVVEAEFLMFDPENEADRGLKKFLLVEKALEEASMNTTTMPAQKIQEPVLHQVYFSPTSVHPTR
ncbi:unnamed protein product, partial [Amoebophrya sp. A25]